MQPVLSGAAWCTGESKLAFRGFSGEKDVYKDLPCWDWDTCRGGNVATAHRLVWAQRGDDSS